MYQLSLNNKKVFEFYKNNPTLNFEQANLLCIQLFENILLNVQLNTQFPNILNKAKCKFAENHLKNILEENIENSEISIYAESQTPHSCDLLLIRGKPHLCNILIENKIYNTKVPTVEIDKFREDCRKEKTHGIILSQFSKITLKDNYQIDIIDDKFILVYVNDVKDEFYKIQNAINIIDIVDKFIRNNISTDLNENTVVTTISKEIIMEINQEVQNIQTQKEIIINMVKEFHKKLLLSIEELKLPTLNKFLQDNYNTGIVNTGIVNTSAIQCMKCKNFNAKSKVALAAHQKSKLCLATFNKNVNELTII